jgi:tRNA 2-(methylsulfanyl)-N6-isopentenyladenosine37 hydroxylase
MLCLRSSSPPAWLHAALADVDAVLVDHAHCEHKAAVTALAFVSRYPDDPVLVERLSALAAEEANHLARVSALCHARGLSLGHPAKDPYAKALLSHTRPDALGHRVDRLLVCALIEARSCERLKLLAEHLPDAALRVFYDELWRCEAGHYTLFKELAERSVVGGGAAPARARLEVAERLFVLAEAEAVIVASLPVRAAIH